MARGRKTTGPKLVQGLEGSSQSKERLQVILETISGQKTIAQAAEELNLSEARIHALRAHALQGALESMEPKASGRPPKPPPTADQNEVERLKGEIDELSFNLRAAQLREEIGLLMPHLQDSKKRKSKPKKKPRRVRG